MRLNLRAARLSPAAAADAAAEVEEDEADEEGAGAVSLTDSNGKVVLSPGSGANAGCCDEGIAAAATTSCSP